MVQKAGPKNNKVGKVKEEKGYFDTYNLFIFIFHYFLNTKFYFLLLFYPILHVK